VEDSIVRETVVAAPPERVWEVLTTAEYVGRWFGADKAEIDLRPGGSFVMTWAEHGVGYARVERVEEPTAFTFRWGIEYIGRSSANKLVDPDRLLHYPNNGGTGVGGQPYTEDLVAEAYWEHGVSVQYKLRKLAQFTVGVKNLFDRHFHYHEPDPTNPTVYPERFVYMKLEVSF